MVAFPAALDTIPGASWPTAATLHLHKLSTDAHSTLHENIGLAVKALEAKVGIDGSAVATSLDARMASLEGLIASFRGGWLVDPSKWNRVDDFTFSMTGAGNRTADFYSGLKVRWVDNDGGFKYGQVYSSSASGATPNIVTTVAMIPNDDFHIATSGGIQDGAAISTAADPQGFPGMFNFAPGITTSGTSAQQGNRGSTKTLLGKWRTVGKFLIYEFNVTWGGSGIAQGTGSYRMGLPCVARSIGVHNAVGVANIKSGGQEFPGTLVLPTGGVNYLSIHSVNAGWLSMVNCAANVPNTWVSGDYIHGTATVPLP